MKYFFKYYGKQTYIETMSSTPSYYCRYCNFISDNAGVCNDPKSHNFKENGQITCQYYIANTQHFKKTSGPRLKFDLPNRCSDAIYIMQIELEERKKEAFMRSAMKISEMNESEKVRIANWMKRNTPVGKSIGKEWTPYLSRTVKAK